MRAGRSVLRPGDRVIFDDGEHQVVALAGTSVRLRSHDGAEQVVLGVHLMASPGFEVAGGAALPEVEPFGPLDSLPAEVLAAARQQERHVVETETGLPPDAPPGTVPRPGFDPAFTTLAQRDAAKAAELWGGCPDVQQRRADYARQGLWGLADRRAVRAWDPAGRALLVMGLPPDLGFRTKRQLAMDLYADCRADGLEFDFACGDEVYGGCTQLREFFEEHRQAYVLRVASSFMLTLARGAKVTCAEAVKKLVRDRRRWEVRSAGQGSKASGGTPGPGSRPPRRGITCWCAAT